MHLDPDQLAAGYFDLLANAPRRGDSNKKYFSTTRSGIAGGGSHSTRREEHLAAALYRRKEMFFPDGARLRLLDYQLPLKSKQDDAGFGKVDLLGARDDGTLAIVELKTADNAEDRRIALLEGLIYAAVIEANLVQIASELLDRQTLRILQTRPQILILASSEYWISARAVPDTAQFAQLITEISSALPIAVQLLELHDAQLHEMGLNGRPPCLRGHAYLNGQDIGEPQRAPTADRGGYLDACRQTFWKYAGTADLEHDLDPHHTSPDKSPVFAAQAADRNVLVPPQATQDIASRIVAAIPKVERHLWFASMASSQALSQSVFGGLEATGRLQALEGLDAEDGYPAFFGSFSGHRLKLEHAVTTLNEPRPTSLDAFLDGATRVAVEVKFTENEFGRCSRPRIPSRDARFEQDHCDGSYTRQRMRTRNCSLSERGIRYWDFVPELFAWDAGIEHRPCPLSAGYQLVRNVLAACVRADGSIDTDNAHAVIVYDNRNPAFAAGGEANRQWWLVVAALRSPRVLRRVSWQSLAAHLRQFDDLAWLSDGLRDKYGFV